MTTNEDASVAVLVLDKNGQCLGKGLDEDHAVTLVALMSEDPACFEEVAEYWPRYWTPAVCEFASGISMVKVDRREAMQGMAAEDFWVVLDLIQKRILTSPSFMPIGRDAAFDTGVESDDKQCCRVSVHLPPWWELHEHVDASLINAPRLTPIARPVVNRDILYGDALLQDLALRTVAAARSQAWTQRKAANNERSRYAFTVAVHREWLMTPRQDLGGRMPRELLHGAREWSERVVWSQRVRFEKGCPLIAAPDDVEGYAIAPMGCDEMVIYFDLCRELIESAWMWCVTHASDLESNHHRTASHQLVSFLREVRDNWLIRPFEGNSPPSFIIECSRRRVPRGADVPIVGMSQREPAQHLIDCDCPLCQMMAEGMFGIGFTSLDGYHLELDEEFAFSMHETNEDWLAMLKEDEEISAAIERSRTEVASINDPNQDEFALTWSSHVCDEPLPGDSSGHVKLAFLLAEVISVLQSKAADSECIRQLNHAFTQFRTCRDQHLVESAKELKAQLEMLSGQFPELISKAADLQSRIDETMRAATSRSD